MRKNSITYQLMTEGFEILKECLSLGSFKVFCKPKATIICFNGGGNSDK